MQPDVRRWFDRRTSTAADWPPARLLAAKGPTTVSVVLPALNEQATVGPIVASIRAELMERVALVDELVVVDSGSTDATGAVASAAGATVVHRDAILPRIPALPGKGEVLWRGLYATSGDVVVFIDADLRGFTAGFVTGLLGPLLCLPQVCLVKGMYDRPLATDSGLAPAGGGRVTELVARPVLNMYWPRLAGFVQPLAGEYAARRSLLERLPFPCGYGVEIATLIDCADLLGLDAMAQVDLGVRRHRHHDDAALGLMASHVWQAAATRLERDGAAAGRGPRRTGLTQFTRSGDGFATVTTEVSCPERPPMCSVPEYAARRAPGGLAGPVSA